MVLLITIGVFLIVSGLLVDGLVYVADPPKVTNGN